MTDKPTAHEIRQWAIRLGFNVSPQGPLPRPLLERWNQEHPERPVKLPHQWGSRTGEGHSESVRRGAELGASQGGKARWRNGREKKW